MEKPPADVQEWFRCPGCGVPLRVPSETTKVLVVVGIVVMADPHLLGGLTRRGLLESHRESHTEPGPCWPHDKITTTTTFYRITDKGRAILAVASANAEPAGVTG